MFNLWYHAPALVVHPSCRMPIPGEEIDFDGPIERGAKKMRAQRVQEFLTLNGFSVSIDADFGPATEKRVRDFQTARGLPASGIVDMKTHEELVAPIVKALNPIAAGGKSLSALAAAYAKQHIKNRPKEAGGDNRGPWVRSYLDWDGKEAKWCAGFVCFALEQAAHTLGVLPIKSHRPAMCWRWKPRPPESSCQN